jgi:hypothetical protein
LTFQPKHVRITFIRASNLQADRPVIAIRFLGQRFLFASASTQSRRDSQPHTRRVQGSLRYGITRPGREANQPPRFSAPVKYDNVPLSFKSVVLN